MQHRVYKRVLTQVVRKHIDDLIYDTSETMFSFAIKVREHYGASYPEHTRTVEFSTVKDPTTQAKRDAEKLQRFLDMASTARLPVELLESIIAAFPVERRFALQVDIATRQGLLAVPMPEARPGADGESLGAMCKEAGEAITAVSGLLADGVIDENDADQAPDALMHIKKAVSRLLSMRERIRTQALGHTHKNVTALKK